MAVLNPAVMTQSPRFLIIAGLCLGRSEVLRSLRHYLRAQSQGHIHTIDRLEERGVAERGSTQRSSLRGLRERAIIVNQTDIGTVSRGNIVETPERRGGAHVGLPAPHRYHLELN